MTRRNPLAAISLLVLCLGLGACGEAETSPRTESTRSPGPAPETEASEESVTYVPAYPEDVSSEDLSEDDVEQQQSTHSHGGDEHSHGDETHTHDDEEEHDGDDHDHGPSL